MSSRLVEQVCAAAAGRGVVGMSVPSVQCAGDGGGQQIDQIGDVVEVVEAEHRSFDRLGAVAVGDPVGERVELRDELVVGDGIAGRAVRLRRRGRGGRCRRAW